MATLPNAIKKLGQFLSYVLGIQPDEFGLIPNDQGYIPIKELLKALTQEAGWRHLRISHLHQLVAMIRPGPVEIENQLIRATDRHRLPSIQPAEQLPKLLFLAIRRRAYATVMEKGLSAGSRPYLILSSDRAMAQKIGQRIDHEPVVLSIQVAKSLTYGTRYQQYGEGLYLTNTLAIGTFSGPAPPKEREPTSKQIIKEPLLAPKTPGSYFPEMDITTEEKEAIKRDRRRQKKATEKARRQARRDKSRRNL